jgi:hypothetical protein
MSGVCDTVMLIVGWCDDHVGFLTACTLLAILVYVELTRRLAKAARKQAEASERALDEIRADRVLQAQPRLEATVKAGVVLHGMAPGYEVRVGNLGRSPAFIRDVRWEPVSGAKGAKPSPRSVRFTLRPDDEEHVSSLEAGPDFGPDDRVRLLFVYLDVLGYEWTYSAGVGGVAAGEAPVVHDEKLSCSNGRVVSLLESVGVALLDR